MDVLEGVRCALDLNDIPGAKFEELCDYNCRYISNTYDDSPVCERVLRLLETLDGRWPWQGESDSDSEDSQATAKSIPEVSEDGALEEMNTCPYDEQLWSDFLKVAQSGTVAHIRQKMFQRN